MTNPLLQGAEDARRLAAQFAGLVALAVALEEVGSLQQAGDEAQARLDQIAVDHAKRLAETGDEHARALARLDDVKAKIADNQAAIDAANQQAADIRAEAVREAGEHLDRTRNVVSNAQATADAIKASAESVAAAAIRDAENRAAELDGKTDAERARLEAVRAEVKGAEGQLAAIKAEREAILKKFEA